MKNIVILYIVQTVQIIIRTLYCSEYVHLIVLFINNSINKNKIVILKTLVKLDGKKVMLK